MTGLGFVPALPRVTRPRGPWGWGSGMLIQCGPPDARCVMLVLIADADADADEGQDGNGAEDEDVVAWCVVSLVYNTLPGDERRRTGQVDCVCCYAA